MRKQKGKPLGGLWLLLAMICGCDRTGVHHVGTAKLSVAPTAIDFGLTWIGMPQSRQITVHNDGQVEATVPVQVEGQVVGPFSLDSTSLTVAPGADAPLKVTFDPRQPGDDVGRVDLQTLHVSLSGQARAIPDCDAGPCHDTAFDTLSRACVVTFSADGTACHTVCTSGTCVSGQCLGSFDTCDDGNACTSELCSETAGCSHTPTICPAPSTVCQVAMCDPLTGCGATAIADGTSCDYDPCTSNDVHVCISGACVLRPRPSGTRCGDQWAPQNITTRQSAAIAYDSKRQRVVIFGGNGQSPFNDTWEFNGAKWRPMSPAASPPATNADPGVMTYDPILEQVVLFAHGVTWVYDGSTWTQKLPVHSPPELGSPGFTFDTARGVAVLCGASSTTSPTNDTWEWDGADWTQRTDVHGPPLTRRTRLAYDESHQQTVLFSSSENYSVPLPGTTWLYDGNDWTQANPVVSPLGRDVDVFVCDSQRKRVVMAGGGYDETWEWDGTHWAQISTPLTPGERFDMPGVYDEALHQTVAFGGIGGEWRDFENSDTWGYDGGDWASVDTVARPNPRAGASMVYDAQLQQTLLFGGGCRDDAVFDFDADVWAWDGVTWKENLAATGPQARLRAAMVYDSDRSVVVLFGGQTQATAALADTWEFDGSTWTLKAPAHSPPGRWSAAFAYDSQRHRTLIFGGTPQVAIQPYQALADTWVWDGNDWTEVTPAAGPQGRVGAAMAFDEIHGQAVLFGGSLDDGDYVVLDDTWLWDGSAWTQQSHITVPPYRFRQAMAYDSSRQLVMMFGGSADLRNLNDLWEWNGIDWSQRMPSVLPAPISDSPMAYDLARDDLVVFGAAPATQAASGDTWMYVPP